MYNKDYSKLKFPSWLAEWLKDVHSFKVSDKRIFSNVCILYDYNKKYQKPVQVQSLFT
jgi:hypothetical protein